MGLNFKDSDAQWSYGGFMDFRRRLAKEIGIELDQMSGFGGEQDWSSVEDDIVPFLNHSDCDGVMAVQECRRVSPRLRKLVSDWEDGHDKRNALELADDMDRMVKAGQPLIFC